MRRIEHVAKKVKSKGFLDGIEGLVIVEGQEIGPIFWLMCRFFFSIFGTESEKVVALM